MTLRSLLLSAALCGATASAGLAQAQDVAPVVEGAGVGLPGDDPNLSPAQKKLMARRAAQVRALRNAMTGQVDIVPAVNRTQPASGPSAALPVPVGTTRVRIQTTILRTTVDPAGLPQPVPVPVLSPVTTGQVRVEGQVGQFRVTEATQLPNGGYQVKVVVQLPNPAVLTAQQQVDVVRAVQAKVGSALEQRTRLEQDLQNVDAEIIALQRRIVELQQQREALAAQLGGPAANPPGSAPALPAPR